MIALDHIHKSFEGEAVLRDLSFHLAEKQTLSILGKSGCGKSTLLKILAGLETADQGQFLVKGVDLFALPPQQREVVYLSQEPLLFPHLNILRNLTFGLDVKGVPKAESMASAKKLANRLGLSEHLDKMPHQLSGGQKQRVNFGRALIINPRILLLDEPFGSLDAHTREEMQQLYKKVSQEFGITALFVTHDLKEALIMGDQLARMENGQLTIYNSLEEFLNDPSSGAKAEINFWKSIEIVNRKP